jgi:hypothetical protein
MIQFILFVFRAYAIPATNLDILPLNENHPAIGHFLDASTESFASSGGVLYDVQQLERFVGTPFEKKWEKLPTKKEVTQHVWPGPYWPTYEDGINYRWNGHESLSPVEKYAKAFNLNTKQLEDAVSRKSGIDSQRSSTRCKSWGDCSNGACAIRRNQTEGYCIPTWYGICHAWAPAALMEPEPKCPVTVNGVVFEPMDMKALISQIYDGANLGTIFTGQRCNKQSPQMDSNQRFIDDECRDLAPEFFHLAITNLIGRFDKSFVVDVSADYQVWNQPVRSYEIVSQTKLSPAEAMTRFFPQANSTIYSFNQKAKELLHVHMKFSYVLESNENTSGLADRYTTDRYYDYLLELDAQGTIIGGEWVEYSKYNHADFLWFGVGTPRQSTTVTGGIKYSDIKKMITQSLTSC